MFQTLCNAERLLFFKHACLLPLLLGKESHIWAMLRLYTDQVS